MLCNSLIIVLKGTIVTKNESVWSVLEKPGTLIHKYCQVIGIFSNCSKMQSLMQLPVLLQTC